MDNKNENLKSIAHMNYKIKMYRLALIVVPILCSLAPITYIIEKCIGWLESVSWTSLIIFTCTNILYLLIGLYLAKTGTDSNGNIINSKFLLAKIFIITSITIQYNFIYYMIPSEEFWGFIFLFVLYCGFFLDVKMIFISIGLLSLSTLSAWFIKPDLLPVHDELFYINLINIILAIILTLSLITLLVYNIRKYLIIMYSKEASEKENKLNQKLEGEKDARAIAEMASKEKSNFLNQISHQIKTPINVILGMAEMVQRDINSNVIDNGSLAEYVNNINVAGNSLLSLIKEIVEFNKIEEGKQQLINVDYNVEHLLKELLTQTMPKAKAKDIAFNINADENIPKVLYGDVEKLKTILLTIINNAVTYTKEGNVTLKISMVDRSDTKIRLKFSIIDTGIGMKKEDMSKIFNKQPSNDSSGIKSSGLGLNITQSYLAMMDSKLNVDSTYGHGSEFYFEITQEISKSVISNKQAEKSNKDYVQRFATRNASILLVDDVEMNNKMCAGLIRNLGIAIDSALSGEEAISKCKANDYDIIFMDQIMPEMDGITASHEIRKISAYYENAPIVALTGNASVGAKEELLNAGLNDYLPKPITTIQLEDCIKKWLPSEKIIILVEDEEVNENEYEYEEKLVFSEDIAPIPEIDEIDHEEAINILGSEKAFKEALMSFDENLDERLIMLQNAVITLSIEDYVIQTHALKNLAKTIAASRIADNCEFLEVKCEELTSYELKMRTGELIDRILKLKEDISRVLSYSDEVTFTNGKALGDINSLELKMLLNETIDFIDSYQIDNVKEYAKNLLRYNLKEYQRRADELNQYAKEENYTGCRKVIEQWIESIESKEI